jgi:serine/threonine protein kinase
MDVKPSNVLIAGDGLPMLLDFHLARKPIKTGERIADRLGGTPGWMAPEQEAALKAVSLGQPVPDPVDLRADLYALGLLLCDALGGPVPAPNVRPENPGDTATLRSAWGWRMSPRNAWPADLPNVITMRSPWRMTCGDTSMTYRSAVLPTAA